jgi:aminoglycoside phosphotransferase (APT) family kinase protein
MPVEARHRVDEVNLDRWLTEHVDEYKGPLTVRQFRGGQSNPTYRLDTPTKSYVLRRKPFGNLLPSAHAVDREYKVMTALGKQGFPVPATHALCTDEAVIGATFFVMSHVEGRLFWNPALPNVPAIERRGIYTDKIRVLAQLHRYNPSAIALGDFGKPGNYFARQVDRWTRQYRASETIVSPAMNRLIEWLPQTVPTQNAVSVVHGDYRLDNLIFQTSAPCVEAVLDWELSTLGDPLADFTYLLMNWVMPGLHGIDLRSLNIPTIDEAIEIYCAAAGRSSISNLDWYFAYNLFRLAAIGQGIIARVRDGTAASSNPRKDIGGLESLASAAWTFAKKAGA